MATKQTPIVAKPSGFIKFSLAVFLASATDMEFQDYFEFHLEALQSLYGSDITDNQQKG